MSSPYSGKPVSSWLRITKRLIDNHPLKTDVLLTTALSAWRVLWQSSVGSGKTSVPLADLNVPATIVGYFFEVLFTRELERNSPTLWRGGATKEEKDLVHKPHARFSVEIKTSGQAGFRIYGNQSYGQQQTNDSLVTKEKSGYYLTVNFVGQTLTLLRFGWIDADDWIPQRAATGQMAGLKKEVYEYKLLAIRGSYRQKVPVFLLDGVGPKVDELFAVHGIRTIGHLLNYDQILPKRLSRIRDVNQLFLDDCVD